MADSRRLMISASELRRPEWILAVTSSSSSRTVSGRSREPLVRISTSVPLRRVMSGICSFNSRILAVCRRSRSGVNPPATLKDWVWSEKHMYSKPRSRAAWTISSNPARERGLEYICFSDHTQSLSVAGGLSPDRLRRPTARVRELYEQIPDITLPSRAEVDILTKGSLDLPDTVLEELDYVTASIHSGLRSSEAEIMKRLESAMLN